MDNEENIFKYLWNMDNLNTNVDYLDFSTDNFYLLYRDVSDEKEIIDLSI